MKRGLFATPLLLPLVGLIMGQALAYPLLWLVWPSKHLNQYWFFAWGICSILGLSITLKSKAALRWSIPLFVGIALVSQQQFSVQDTFSGEQVVVARISERSESKGRIQLTLTSTRNSFASVSRCTAANLPWRNASQLVAGQYLFARADFRPLQPSFNAFHYDNALRRRRIGSSCKILQVSEPWFQDDDWRKEFTTWLESKLLQSGVTKKVVGLLLASTLGVENALTPEIVTSFKRTGLMHLLVVSGFQVTGIFFCSLWVSKKALNIFWPAQHTVSTFLWLLSWLVALAYVFLLNFPMSAVRALVSLSLVVANQLLLRKSSGYDLLLSCMFVLAVLWPGCFFEPGPELTFAALWAICLGSSTSLIKSKWIGLKVSWWATWASGAVTLLWFKSLSVIGVLLNPFLAPLIGGIGCSVVAGGLFVFSLAPDTLAWLAKSIEFASLPVIWLVENCAALTWAELRVPTRAHSVLIIFGSLIVLLLARRLLAQCASKSLRK